MSQNFLRSTIFIQAVSLCKEVLKKLDSIVLEKSASIHLEDMERSEADEYITNAIKSRLKKATIAECFEVFISQFPQLNISIENMTTTNIVIEISKYSKEINKAISEQDK